MPASRARTAICSAPFEWPSRPGLPTRILIRRPSASDTRSTLSLSSRSASSSGAAAASATPVGARYSPNTSRSVPAHSPVVAPAVRGAARAVRSHVVVFNVRPAPPAPAVLRHDRHLLAGSLDQFVDEVVHHLGTLEDVRVLEQVGLVGQDLLDPQGPL